MDDKNQATKKKTPIQLKQPILQMLEINQQLLEPN